MPHAHLRAPSAWPTGWLAPDLHDAEGRLPPGVLACMTARAGGVSLGPHAGLNLGQHVGDEAERVARNRALVAQAMAELGREAASATGAGDAPGRAMPPTQPWPVAWLDQVHGADVCRLRRSDFSPGQPWSPPRADGALTTEPGVVCAVMVADCLPVLLAVRQGGGVAALHAGWRGLAGAGAMQGRGIVESGVAGLCEATGASPSDLVAWLGPCIGPQAFQVGPEVLQAFGVDPGDVRPHPRFQPDAGAGAAAPKWWADLPGLARDRLQRLGVGAVHGGSWCTVSSPDRFFSYRRDGVTGRQVALIAMA